MTGDQDPLRRGARNGMGLVVGVMFLVDGVLALSGCGAEMTAGRQKLDRIPTNLDA